MIGDKIKALRAKSNMTQKGLADKLFVTSQAVSRWENGEVEPSISTVSEMAKIFNVTIDSLVNEDIKIDNEVKEVEPVVEPVVEEKVVYKELPKIHLCLCEKCNGPIYEQSDIHRFNTVHSHHQGRRTIRDSVDHIYCTNCYNKKLEEERIAAELKAKEEDEARKKRRIHSFVWPSIIGAIIVLIGIVMNNIAVIIGGLFAYTFVASLILDNNFIGDLWLGIASWSVKLPGVIFTLDLDGILFLITVKILGAVLSFFLSACAIALATALGMALSVFVYPVALTRSFQGKDDSILD